MYYRMHEKKTEVCKLKFRRCKIVSITCDVTAYKYNTGGSCDRVNIYISDAETGDPICQDAEFDGEEY
mgnify:FL=1|jgi:hypothetical protein